jgi:peptidoglycan/xylan/chitin deacetylase (PgdA/CDA1 family)
LIAKSLFYSWLQRRHPSVLFHGDSSRREIALTFDDGPHPRDTPQVLSALAKHKVQATFFLIGQSVERYPQLVREIHQNGHQLGLHCYHHLPFLIENPALLRKELDHTRNLIADTCGVSPETICDVRPPYGFFTAKTSSLLREWEYRLVLWNSIPPHWMQPFNWTVKQILDSVVPGSVIVLHDGKGHGSKVAHIVDAIIPRLRALDFTFIKVENMRK